MCFFVTGQQKNTIIILFIGTVHGWIDGQLDR